MSDRRDTLKEMTHRNLRIIYKMQVKSCRNIFRVYVRNDSRREIYSRGGLVSTTSCAYLYTCPFWISVRLYLRGRSKSDKQSGVFPKENETKVNYNKLDY